MCGSEFEGRSDARYCSHGCRTRAYRDRRGDPGAGATAELDAEALSDVQAALAHTRERIERATAEGMTPAWERYYWTLASAIEKLRAPQVAS
jgi:hypothetical protein